MPFAALGDGDEPFGDRGLNDRHIPSGQADAGFPGAGEAAGEIVLCELIDPDIRGGVMEIVRLLEGGKATLPGVIVGIIQASLDKEIDVSGPRAEHLRAQAMASLRECLVGLGMRRSRSSRPRTAAERSRARGRAVDPSAAGQACVGYLGELYAVARRRPGPLGVSEADIIDVDAVVEEEHDGDRQE